MDLGVRQTIDNSNSKTKSDRLLGLDVARAIAIAGMTLIHFAMVLSANRMDGSLLSQLVDRLSGRPATVFMILAGIGVSLRFKNKSVEDSTPIRRSLIRRGVFFFVVGFVNLAIWPGDILRVYGVAYLCAAWLVTSSNRRLLTMATSVIATFVVLVFTVDFGTNWDFETLTYSKLWTGPGALMNLFYNGFRAVFPWIGFLFIGMWIGRRNLSSPVFRKRMTWTGLLVCLTAECSSHLLLRMLDPFLSAAERSDVFAVLGTDSLPAMPFFLLSSGGLAIALIMLCVEICEKTKPICWHQPFASAGQLAFTWYIAHIALVILAGEITGFAGNESLPTAFFAATIFLLTMLTVSGIYRCYCRFGPLEWTLRKVAG